jgi:hypothetical protein
MLALKSPCGVAILLSSGLQDGAAPAEMAPNLFNLKRLKEAFCG